MYCILFKYKVLMYTAVVYILKTVSKYKVTMSTAVLYIYTVSKHKLLMYTAVLYMHELYLNIRQLCTLL